MPTQFFWRVGLLCKKEKTIQKETGKRKRMKLRAFTLKNSLTHLCKDIAFGAFCFIRSAKHMRSNVSCDAKIDKAAADIYRRESERKRASEGRTERDKVSDGG